MEQGEGDTNVHALAFYMLAYISFSVGCRFICSKVYQSRSYNNSTILTLLSFINLPLGDWGIKNLL